MWPRFKSYLIDEVQEVQYEFDHTTTQFEALLIEEIKRIEIGLLNSVFDASNQGSNAPPTPMVYSSNY